MACLAGMVSRAVLPKENYGTSVDIYAFGMVLLELRGDGVLAAGKVRECSWLKGPPVSIYPEGASLDLKP